MATGDKPTLAIINTAMEVYPYHIAEPVLCRAVEALSDDFRVTVSDVCFDMDSAAAAGRRALCEGACAAVLFFSTWVDASVPVAAVLELGDTPLLLWALPMIEGNSTGSLVGHAVVKGTLERMGRDFEWAYGLDEEVVPTIRREAKAAAVARSLRGARFGLFGYASMGMYTATADHLRLRQHLGPELVHFDSAAILTGMREVGDDEADEIVGSRLARIKPADESLAEPLRRAARMYLVLRRIVDEQTLAAVTVKCQHEISRTVGCTCIPLALLVEDGLPCTCEGDVYGLVTAAVMRRLAGSPGFFCDFINAEEQAVWFSSCGFIPPSLTKGELTAVRQIEEIGTEGVALSASPKTGPVTFARLDEGPGGTFRMHLGAGTVAEGYRRRHLTKDGEERMLFPIMKVDLGYPCTSFLDNVLANHYVITYGDWSADLESVCKAMASAALRDAQ